MAESVKVWTIRPSSNKEAKKFAPLFWEKGVAAIDYVGSSGAGDLHDYTLPQLKDVVRRVRCESGKKQDKGAVTRTAKQLWQFANEIRANDWILSPKPTPDDIMIGRCTSAYEYAPGGLYKSQFPYIIRVDWIIDIPADWLSEDLRSSIKGKRQSLWNIKDRHIPELESLCKLALENRLVPLSLPSYLVDGVDELVGERGRKHFIVHVVLKELEETEKIRKEKEESGEEFHPDWETSAMVYAWVRASRDLDNERLVEKWGGKVSL